MKEAWTLEVIIAINLNQKIAKSVIKPSNSGLQKPLKLSKYLFKNADVSKNICKNICFDKKSTKSMFLHLKTLIKAKYRCEKQEKVEQENST